MTPDHLRADLTKIAELRSKISEAIIHASAVAWSSWDPRLHLDNVLVRLDEAMQDLADGEAVILEKLAEFANDTFVNDDDCNAIRQRADRGCEERRMDADERSAA
ncbi:MAG: hypothetical protein QJR02_15930 [Sinobacteraceae bacterium]|nr:hypothetical protein [Nevskiaceae bacterium]